MKYRTKLYIALVGTAALACTLALGIDFIQSRRTLFKELQSKILSIATTTASLIDADLLENLTSDQDPRYTAFQKQLRAARSANLREDIEIRYVYTVQPDRDNPLKMHYLVDSAENIKDLSPIGSIYNDIDKPDVLKNLLTPFASNYYVKDEWGTWLSAFAPLYRADGSYIATLAVDIQASQVQWALQLQLIYGLIDLFIVILIASIIAFFLSQLVTRSLESFCKTMHQVEKGNLKTEAQSDPIEEFDEMAMALNKMIKGLQERQLVASSFGRYLSPAILERILSSGKLPVRNAGEKRPITVLFIDIRDFTARTESMHPTETIELLNECFTEFVEVILRYNGALDKYLGDGLIAEFGTFETDNEKEKHSILAALEIFKRLEKLNDKWIKLGKWVTKESPLRIGIGIHTGDAIVGNIGSETRMEFTAIGECVNIASRLQAATKEFTVSLLISEQTVAPVKKLKDFNFALVSESFSPRGSAKPIKIYTIKPSFTL